MTATHSDTIFEFNYLSRQLVRHQRMHNSFDFSNTRTIEVSRELHCFKLFELPPRHLIYRIEPSSRSKFIAQPETTTGFVLSRRITYSLTKLRDAKIIITGGMVPQKLSACTTTDIYNVETKTWTKGPYLIR